MSDSVLQSSFEERLAEVKAYLAFLTDLENAGQSGPPRFYNSSKPLSPQQVQILKAGIFVQLYNLVEATVSRCLDALTKASSRGPWKAADLIPIFAVSG